MLELVITFLIAAMAFISGAALGEIKGREQVHKQEYSCQTLPDKTIHCWENKENQ